jgi:hypothetical protein
MLCLYTYLSAPAKANDSPLLDASALTKLLHNFGDAWQSLGRCSLSLEKLAELLALLLVVWWVPRDVGGLSFEEIWHEDLVLVIFVRVGQDISSLESLVEEAKDVVDNKYALFCVLGTGSICITLDVVKYSTDIEHTCLQSVNLNVVALWRVAFADDGGRVAACLRLRGFC